ncbi:hypothetical protein HJ01_01679 [Flavobacterium frigoris PS1]|uniref:Uncharacterized protein n=1 Tax=Flavobacterium frigoris (strain PS1) TaxID=1086011 RepID=H7FRD0_FLAFP|nr:hypothetical protein HJ01_01679 [Flavobacterium frigoris PS1]
MVWVCKMLFLDLFLLKIYNRYSSLCFANFSSSKKESTPVEVLY